MTEYPFDVGEIVDKVRPNLDPGLRAEIVRLTLELFDCGVDADVFPSPSRRLAECTVVVMDDFLHAGKID